MRSMGTRARVSRALLEKGKFAAAFIVDSLMDSCRFGWVNASYVYGLEFLNAHMRRSLGAITPWETYTKAIESQGGV